MANKKNRNIQIIKTYEELENEVDYEQFEYRDYFYLICNLIPNKEKERLEIEVIDTDACNDHGLVYVFVVKGKIFKIGESITPIVKRVQSYNCGKVEYRINGTNSTTNYFVLQSLLAINEVVQVYAFFPQQPEYEIFGKKYKDSWPVSKRAENIIINAFIANHEKKPIGCTQR
ncbi:MAG: GIY-YIG nuclease family protein [Bacilli bacterium]|nr:GIY-YIG nuclease family protein [Bacilli bacterium]